MKQVVDLWNRILTEGEERKDRTGTGTKSVFGGPELKFDLRDRFPLVTMKKTLYKSAFIEMLWFLRGEPNTAYLKKYGVPIWDDWADVDGNLGPIYGVQWRKWPGKIHSYPMSKCFESAIVQPENFIGFQAARDYLTGEQVYMYQEKVDQIKNLIDGIKKNPIGRRHIVTAWNPGFIDMMGLPPCHRDFQCYVSNDGHLDLKMAIRSWDTGLGLPFNIAQYALLTHLLARATNLQPRYLSITYGDAHIYLNHLEQIKQRIAEAAPIDCPTELVINTENTDIDGYKPEDFDVIGYTSHPFLKLPIAV